MIVTGDAVEVMAGMEPDSVDAIVTDPPYSLAFMGRAWDTRFGHGPWAEAAYRVARPSAYLLAFGGTRTVHRMTVALEDAGWIIRDMLVWAYASGFPKSKASLKPAWEPIVMARKPGPLRMLNIDATRLPTDGRATSQDASGSSGAGSRNGTAPWLADDPQRHNPSTLLRAWSAARPEADSAPLANALADAFVGRGVLGSRGGYPSCRRCGDGLARIAEAADREDAPLRPDVPGAPDLLGWTLRCIHLSRCDDHPSTWDELTRVVAGAGALPSGNGTTGDVQQPLGRWPSNVLLTATDDGRAIFDGDVPGVVGGGESVAGVAVTRNGGGGKWYDQRLGSAVLPDSGYGDSGTYSRFFLVPKSSRSDREPVFGGLEAALDGGVWGGDEDDLSVGKKRTIARRNTHPTVKPVELMRHLVRLVTPPGGTVLDPFAGSGSTLIAAENEGFPWIGIEREAEYVAIIEARLQGVQRGLGLSA